MRRKQRVTVYLLLMVPFIFLNFPHTFDFLKRTSMAVMIPVLRTADFVTGKSFRLAERLVYPHWLVQENQKLNQRIDELEIYLKQLAELDDENQRLHNLLEFSKTVSGQTMPAQVIGRDANQWRSSLMINKGKKDGLEVNMPVLTDLGLVGLVAEVGQSASRVVLVTDPAFKVSGLVQSSRVEGIVQGHGMNDVRLHYVAHDADVRVNDVIITSGLGGVFPKGFVLGAVRKVGVERNKLFKSIVLKPSVNTSALEEVLVLLNVEELER